MAGMAAESPKQGSALERRVPARLAGSTVVLLMCVTGLLAVSLLSMKLGAVHLSWNEVLSLIHI